MDLIASTQAGLVEHLEDEAAALAGRPRDLVQRGIAYHHLYDCSGGAHAYALLAAWAAWLFETSRARSRALLSLCLLGVLIEVAQGTLTTHRMMDWRDAIADFAGVALGGWLALRWPAALQHFDRKIGQR